MQVRRGVMGLVGALAGWCLYALGEVWAGGLLPERAALGLSVFGAVFFGGWLAMAGPLRLMRAGVGAAALGVVVTGLVLAASLRFDAATGILEMPDMVLAMLILATLPLPFWIAGAHVGQAHGGRAQWGWAQWGWAHYPTLFAESWGIVVRFGAAAVFTACVWAVVWLSDALLALVGIAVIGDFLAVGAVPAVLTGAAFGLALGVVSELSDYVSPYLLLRLLRLLLPVVLAVMAVFLVALSLGGMGRLLGGLSVAGTLLAMALVAVALVSAAVDGRDGTAAQGTLARLARVLAVLVVVPGALAVWAIWLRVGDAGWSPARLAAAAAACVALGYGALYLAAAVAGGGWMARVRRANVAMALGVMALAALWLTPVLNAERVAARDMVARYAAGRIPLARLDLEALDRWGRAGAAARAQLEVMAAAPGQEGLAARLAVGAAGGPAATRAGLAALMPVSPAGADAGPVIAALEPWVLADWQAACARRLEDGAPACVLVLADFWPDTPGHEAVALFLTPEGWLRSEARVIGPEGVWQARPAMMTGEGVVQGPQAEAALRALQSGPPGLLPVVQNALRLGPLRLIIQP